MLSGVGTADSKERLKIVPLAGLPGQLLSSGLPRGLLVGLEQLGAAWAQCSRMFPFLMLL